MHEHCVWPNDWDPTDVYRTVIVGPYGGDLRIGTVKLWIRCAVERIDIRLDKRSFIVYVVFVFRSSIIVCICLCSHHNCYCWVDNLPNSRRDAYLYCLLWIKRPILSNYFCKLLSVIKRSFKRFELWLSSKIAIEQWQYLISISFIEHVEPTLRPRWQMRYLWRWLWRWDATIARARRCVWCWCDCRQISGSQPDSNNHRCDR